MPDPIPGRDLPEIRGADGGAGDAESLRVRLRIADGDRAAGPAVRRMGRADDVSVDEGPTLVVDVDPTEPRAGWAGAVDSGLPWRRAGASLARYLAPGARRGRGPLSLNTTVDGGDVLSPEQIENVALGYQLGAHQQDALATEPTPLAPALVVDVGADDDGVVRRALDRAVTAARTTVLAREAAGTPSNIKTPAWLAERYREVLEAAGMDVTVLAGEDLAEFGGVRAVGEGSAHPPRVLVARRPGSGRRVLLVGKGITFDTGGISVKPAANMHLMRTDMGGSAAVVAGAADYCAGSAGGEGADGAAGAVDLTVVVPMAENMLSGTAYRPGDVVTHLGGRTTEVANTDAEGRMVLADGIVHGIEVADPEVIIDAATLTGAMKVALGMRTGAVMSTSDDLAAEISHAGAAAGERWWRLPLLDDLDEAVESDIADGRQAPPGPGAITAAKFLQPFADGRPWAHLDMAGPGRAEEEIDEVAPVATGFGARTLATLLRDFDAE